MKDEVKKIIIDHPVCDPFYYTQWLRELMNNSAKKLQGQLEGVFVYYDSNRQCPNVFIKTRYFEICLDFHSLDDDSSVSFVVHMLEGLHSQRRQGSRKVDTLRMHIASKKNFTREKYEMALAEILRWSRYIHMRTKDMHGTENPFYCKISFKDYEKDGEWTWDKREGYYSRLQKDFRAIAKTEE